MERVRFARSDPRLGRNVNHDPRSRRFPARTTRKRLKSVVHERHIPVFQQGELGSCTGNAALGCLATGPFWDSLGELERANGPFWESGITWSQESAVQLYSAATDLDGFHGSYPPEDTGSDGLSVAKVLKDQWSVIAGYEHAFGIDQALQALQYRPAIVGTIWTEAMFEPNRSDGTVRPRGADAGGHEYVMDSYDAGRHLVGFTNSWGPDWGRGGRFFMAAEDFADLLARQGDVTVFVPLSEPAPSPEPVA